MRCETTSPGVQECALCASSAYDVHHASVCVNVVIGVLVVLCELHVIVRVHVIPLCDDAVVGLTLSLIAHVVRVVFVAAILHRIFLYGRHTLYTFICGTSFLSFCFFHPYEVCEGKKSCMCTSRVVCDVWHQCVFCHFRTKMLLDGVSTDNLYNVRTDRDP